MSKILLQLKDVSYRYPGMDAPLFENVTFSVRHGERIGLLGFNGSGKTTLLDIIAGRKREDSGEIHKLCEHIFYMQQENYASGEMTVFQYIVSVRPDILELYARVRDCEKRSIPDPIKYAELINEFKKKHGYAFVKQAEKILDIFGFSGKSHSRNVNTLSGGEKRLLKLASGFLTEHELYILDEPTNYFDDNGIQYLVSGIKETKNTLLIVSHDRWFLDQTVRKILELEQRTVKEYTGNYSTFFRTKQTYIKEKLKKRAKIQTQIKKLHDVKRTYTIWSKRKEKEKKGAYDKGRIGHKAAKLMKKAIQARDRIQNKIDELEQSKPYIERFYEFKFEKPRIHKGSCLSVNNITKRFGDKTLFRDVSFTVDWGEKIAIAGPNGSGKTTLLYIILNKVLPDSGSIFWDKLTHVGYCAQQWTPEQDKYVVSGLFQKDMHERARTLIGVLKVMVHGDVFNKRFGELSEGQKRKVGLVQLILTNPNIVILDEPTTHLDYQTVEFLEKALQEFNGTVILVSHDRFLRERVVSREIRL